jgi:chaperonin GroEL (HSP60 family)
MMMSPSPLVISVAKRLQKIDQKLVGLSLTTTSEGLQLLTRLQTLFSLKFTNPEATAIYDILMSYALKAEKTVPGGFDVCVKTVIQTLLSQDLGNSLKSLKKRLEDTSSSNKMASADDLEYIISSMLDEPLRSYVKSALDLVGFGGQIIIERSASQFASIESIQSYSFELNPDFAIKSNTNKPYVACIDGFIESVGEINNLLESFAQTKDVLIMFVRGMAPDVKQTLKINYDRGSLNVIPVTVPFDLEGINTLVDLAVVTGTDVVSSNKGQLISTLNVSDLKTVTKVSFSHNRINISNASTSKQVKLHVQHLQKRRDDAIDESVARLFIKRIRTLVSNQAIIRLPSDMNFIASSQTIDYALRNIRTLVSYGVIDGNLTSTIVVGTYQALKCCQQLLNVGSIVTS